MLSVDIFYFSLVLLLSCHIECAHTHTHVHSDRVRKLRDTQTSEDKSDSSEGGC